MTQLIRLVYASRSTFSRSAQHQGLDPGVARILAKSRKNNARRQIVGGLLFGDGSFLQCLEGEQQAVETLYEKIAADPRHREVKVLLRRTIGQRSFGSWSMKYVPGEVALRDQLRAWGAPRFDPYSLTVEQIGVAVELMRQQPDAVDTLPNELDDAPVRAPARDGSGGGVKTLKPSPGVVPAASAANRRGLGSGLRLGALAVVVSSLAVAAYWKLG